MTTCRISSPTSRPNAYKQRPQTFRKHAGAGTCPVVQFRPILDGDSTTLIIQDLGNLEIVQEPLSALPGDSQHVGQMGDPPLISGAASGIGDDAVCHLHGKTVDFGACAGDLRGTPKEGTSAAARPIGV